MRTVPCPRCQGTGIVEEDQTLIGLVPFQDRPSVVNDDEWVEPPAEMGEPTRVQSVPSFKMPKIPGGRLPSPKPPPDLTRLAHDSERPTRLIHRREVLLGRPSRWPLFAALVIGLGGGVGIAVGFPFFEPWITFAIHAVRSRLGL